MKLNWAILLVLGSIFGFDLANADDLVDRLGESYAGLPEKLKFECKDGEKSDYWIFGREFQKPENFEVNSSGYDWRVPIANGIVSLPYASIEIGTSSMMIGHAHSLPAVSEQHENPLGAYIVAIEPDSEDKKGNFSVFIVLNEQYLIIRSVVPIVWESIIQCFASPNSPKE